MSVWQEIVNKATLGSAKQRILMSDIPETISEEFELTETQDPEEDFLRLSSLTFQYRQTGAQASDFQKVLQTEADAETKSYCSTTAGNTLKSIIEEELYPFLSMWLHLCSSKELIVTPDLIPTLLDIANKKKEFQKLILTVSGRRGEWLCSLNPSWNFQPTNFDKNLWETGKLEERKELLRHLRLQNSTEALDLLKATWSTEGANEKNAFLEILGANPSSEDLPWLESLKEKSQKVNGAIRDLLTSIPTSTLVQEYVNILKNTINIKTGKALLGMISKTTLEIVESPDIPESVFKSGIEKLSSDKNISDNQYILRQLISSTPPTLWNEHFGQSNESIIQLFQKEKKTTLYLPALALAAAKFKNREWAKDILDNAYGQLDNISVITLMKTVDYVDRDAFAKKFVRERPEVIHLMADQQQEWSLDLAKIILKYTANEVYAYNRVFYRNVATLIPVDIINLLDSFEPDEVQKKAYWKTQSDELLKLLTLKQEILQSFDL